MKLELYILMAWLSLSEAQCPQDWLQLHGVCYILDTAKDTAHNAKAHCSVHGAHLPTLETPLKNANFNIFLLIQNYSQTVWIGGSQDWVQGVWTWDVTDHPFTYTNWAPGHPQMGRGDCGAVSDTQGGTWVNRNCDEKHAFVCERRISS